MPGDRKTPRPEGQEQSSLISIHVIPRSSKVSIEKIGANEYKVKLHTPPVEGAANRELIRLISEKLDIPRSQIQIRSGEKTRTKVITILGMSHEEVAQKLNRKERQGRKG